MCERSKKPARLRTASCSAKMPAYCTGISKPPNGTMRAPSVRCTSNSAVRRSGSSSITRTLREDVARLREFAAQVQRQAEQAPVRLGIVEEILAAQLARVSVDRRRFERRHVVR